MNKLEKRDFIHSNLHLANEQLLDEIYEKLKDHNLLKYKLQIRAQKAEVDIKEQKFFSRNEIEIKKSKEPLI